MPLQQHEALDLASSLLQSLDPQAVRLASLITLSDHVFGQIQRQRQMNLVPLLSLQRECVYAFMQRNRLPRHVLDDALIAMQRAQRTAEILHTIPE